MDELSNSLEKFNIKESIKKGDKKLAKSEKVKVKHEPLEELRKRHEGHHARGSHKWPKSTPRSYENNWELTEKRFNKNSIPMSPPKDTRKRSNLKEHSFRSISGSVESLHTNRSKEDKRRSAARQQDYERKKGNLNNQIKRNFCSSSLSLSSSYLSINDLDSNDSDGASCSSQVRGNSFQRHHSQHKYTMQHQPTGKEAFSMSYINELSRKSNDSLLRILKSQMSEFKNLFELPLKRDYIIPLLNFILKLCRIEYESSKKELLIIVLNSAEFIRNVSSFIDNIIEYSRTVSEIERNAKIFIMFFTETVNYVPKEKLLAFNDLVLKTIYIMKKIDNLPPEFVKSAKLCSTLLTEKSSLIDEKFINYKTLSVFPTKEDLREEVALRPNITNGPYSSVEDYIDIQFKLLKEDFLYNLRSGINIYQTQLREKTKIRNNDIFVYKNVTYIGLSHDDNPTKSLIHIFELDTKFLGHVKWDVTKRLVHGSLLLFSNDNFQSSFLGIFNDRHGFQKKSDGWTISVALIGKSLELNRSSQYVMIESRVFYEPYRHVLNTLKSMQPENFPLRSYIISAETIPKRPKYLDENANYVIADIEVPVNNPDLWPAPENIGLNQSQLEALQAALTRELVVIQGPPGTGKTYLGIKIIDVLLDNKDQWSDGKSSIFVACYRNNAVDQILESIKSKRENVNVVRLGGRSASDILKDHTIKNTIGHLRDPIMFNIMNELKNDIKEIKLKIIELEKVKTFIKENKGILSLEALSKVMAPCHFTYLSASNSYGDWLLNGEESELFNDDWDDLLDSPNIQKMKKYSLVKGHQYVFLSIRDILEELESLDYQIENCNLYLFDKYGHNSSAAHPEEIAALANCMTLYDDKLILLKKVIHRLEMKESKTPLSKLFESDLGTLSNCERWTLYKYWVGQFVHHCECTLEQLIEEHDIKHLDFLEKRDSNDGELLRMARVEIIGATTTGAARLSKLLSLAKPKIVILEEAAEVLEAHAIASINENCEHLILIGDHKQLRPSPASHISSTKYHLDVSLFERMIINGMECFTLTEQHRMRPEISALVVPQIYPTLSNHPSVELYPALRGVKKNLFFVDHRVSEDVLNDNDSHQNMFEAYFILALADYMVKQGYEPSSITVLTVYGAQLLFMKSIQDKFQNLRRVEIQVVDNFQGEENDVILLSLVRSNSTTIGFLSKENRVCVALSRAKQGFIIIGNMETLQLNSSVWKQIKRTLEDNSSLGECLPLKCETHRRITNVKTSEDFKRLKYGGCTFECGIKLECGHTCTFLCHSFDQGHEKEFSCPEPCLRLRNCGVHNCTSKCGNECPKCDVKIPIDLPCDHKGFKICEGDVLKCEENCTAVLKCGHLCPKACHYDDSTDHETMECSAVCNKPNEACPYRHPCSKRCGEICGLCTTNTLIELECGHISEGICHKVRETKCGVRVDKELNCGHNKQAPCCQPIEEIKCDEMVKFTLDCSHEIERLCQTPKEDLICKVEIEKFLPCGHKEMSLCSTPLEEIVCNSKVTKLLPCGHLYQDALCSSNPDDLNCEIEVSKHLSCDHTVTLPCHKTKAPIVCPKPCTKILGCGHKCTSVCGKVCPACRVKVKVEDVCGHERAIACSAVKDLATAHKLGSDDCENVCNELLKCSHTCKGTCGECMQGRIHNICEAVCNKRLICSHRCRNKCWDDYHACNKNCLNACRHQMCQRKCGEICSKCMEPCGWACSHYKCTRKCWEVCNRPPCQFPCQLSLKCRHTCFGFCGDPCPPLCLICTPEEQHDIKTRLILLEECGHVLSKECATELLMKSVGIILCPQCETPLVKTKFFRGHVQTFFKNYSKTKTNAQVIYNNKGALLRDFRQKFRNLNKVLKKKYEGCDSLNKLLQNLLICTKPIMKNKKLNESKSNLKSLLFICSYVIEALKMTKVDGMNEKYTSELLLLINHLATFLLHRNKRISPVEMSMFNVELVRLRYIIDLMQLEQDRNFRMSELCDKKFYEVARSISYGLKRFSEKRQSTLKECLNMLKSHLCSNYILLSDDDDYFQKISHLLDKYYPITFHSENWCRCNKSHIFYSFSPEKNICPLCTNDTNNALFFP